MSHSKAKMHRIRFLAFVRLSLCPLVSKTEFDTVRSFVAARVFFSVKDGGRQSSRGHVFISYQWDSKPTILKISERLKQNGINIWVDVNNMST